MVAAFVVAEAAVLLLRPRGVLAPADVDVRDFFTPAQIERARDFTRPQLALFGVQLAVQAGVLAVLVVRPPRLARRLDRRPLLGGAAAGAALSLTLTVATLPLSAIAHARAKDVGLSTQGWPAWLGDVLRSVGIGMALAAAGGLLAMALIRRFPRHWWIPGSAAVVLIGAAFVWAGPVVLDPVFNSFTKVPPGKVRTEVLDLARRAGVKVGEVYVSDASRRTTAYNAYVTGVGATKRVVLYDTLVHGATDPERRLVVAHELGHVHYRDVPNGLLYLLLVAPLGTFAVFALTRRMAGDAGRPSALPALALSLSLVATPIGWISNGLSRAVEARADQFSLELTGEPKAAIALERRLAITNVNDPDPPAWIQAVLGTHPATIDRIGQAVRYRREHPGR
jgi:STE24 endopeptidase